MNQQNMLQNAFVQAVNNGQLQFDKIPPGLLPEGVSVAPKTGMSASDGYKMAQTRKIDWSMSPEGQENQVLMDYMTDPDAMFEAGQAAAKIKAATGKDVSPEDLLEQSGMNRVKAFRAVKQNLAEEAQSAIVAEAKDSAFNKAGSPKERKIIMAEALAKKYPDKSQQEIVSMVNNAFDSMPSIITGIEVGMKAGNIFKGNK